MLCEQNINMAAIRENTLPLDKNSIDTAASARASTAALNLAFKGIFLGSIQVKLNILSLMLNINKLKKKVHPFLLKSKNIDYSDVLTKWGQVFEDML